jgi:ATP-dependent protease HslVU (ClpYQ) ATPase subunit
MEEISFDAPYYEKNSEIVIDKEFVKKKIEKINSKNDLSKFII